MSKLLRAAGMRGFEDLLAASKLAPEPLLAAAGIPAEALHDDELRISLTGYCQLLEHAAELTNRTDFGLAMAEHQDISILGPIAIAMKNAPTVREGMAVFSQFLHTHSPGIRLTLHDYDPDPAQITLRVTLIVPSWLPSRQVMDQCMADLHHFTVWLANESSPATAVLLPHQPAASMSRYTGVFGVRPQFDQPHAEMRIDRGLLDRSLAGASAELHRLSVQFLQLRYAPDNQTVGEQVADVVRRALSATRGRRTVIADLLGMHPRTLQRRLAAEGLKFQDIVDDIRRAETVRWLTQTDTPLAHIPGLVGLSDQSGLTRNCQRWFGNTPGQIRKAGLSHAAAHSGSAVGG